MASRSTSARCSHLAAARQPRLQCVISSDRVVRDPVEAVKLAQRACELTNYEQPQLLDTLAAAYAAAGKFPEAVETAEKALKRSRDAGEEQVESEIHSRLDLYRSGKAYHAE